ncbi:MAG TPA: hypothetical protein VFI28_01625 [Candidatus Limnocylindrales bacterium]|nr:hypothetical protein [Candidatus Limnocylindrales bacterium]
MAEFVFMLTKDDATVPAALETYEAIRPTALRYVGFKDVGQPVDVLRRLVETMHEDGRTVMLEVVSERRDDELRSIETALGLGVDWLLGGTHADDGLRLTAGSGVRYCPFPGTVIGHPSLLRGTVEGICGDARALTAREGVHGLDLLAYRYDGDVEGLVGAVCAAASGPVITAGSIDSLERIAAIERLGAWGFTIGGAIFDGLLPGGPDVRAQVEAVLEFCGRQDAGDPVAAVAG